MKNKTKLHLFCNVGHKQHIHRNVRIQLHEEINLLICQKNNGILWPITDDLTQNILHKVPYVGSL
jgi:hypothetical protein